MNRSALAIRKKSETDFLSDQQVLSVVSDTDTVPTGRNSNHTENISVNLRRADMYVRAGKFEQASTLYKKVLAISPGEWGALTNLGYALWKLSRLEEAAGILEKAIAIWTDDARPYYTLGLVYGELGVIEKTITPFRRAIKNNPSNLYAYFFLTVNLIRLKRYEEALATAEAAVDLDTSNAFALLMLGTALYEMGRYDDAIDPLKRALPLEIYSLDMLKSYGGMLVELEMFEAASVVFRKATKAFPNDASVRFGLARALNKLDRRLEAVDAFKEALAFQHNEEASIELGGLLHDLGQFDAAASTFKEAISVNPNSPILTRHLGWALYEAHRYDEALVALERAVSINPDAGTFCDLGTTLLQLGRYSEAEKAFSASINIHPNAINFGLLGNAYDLLGKYSEALIALERAIGYDPNNSYALHSLGSVFYDLERFNDAIDVLQRATAIEPNNASVRFILGATYSHLRQFDEAIKYFDSTVRLVPKDAVALAHLTANLVKSGQVEEALKRLDEVRDWHEVDLELRNAITRTEPLFSPLSSHDSLWNRLALCLLASAVCDRPATTKKRARIGIDDLGLGDNHLDLGKGAGRPERVSQGYTPHIEQLLNTDDLDRTLSSYGFISESKRRQLIRTIIEVLDGQMPGALPPPLPSKANIPLYKGSTKKGRPVKKSEPTEADIVQFLRDAWGPWVKIKSPATLAVLEIVGQTFTRAKLREFNRRADETLNTWLNGRVKHTLPPDVYLPSEDEVHAIVLNHFPRAAVVSITIAQSALHRAKRTDFSLRRRGNAKTPE